MKIVPDQFIQDWYRWLGKIIQTKLLGLSFNSSICLTDNIQDWCISRQLWWGHEIPAYQIKLKGITENSGN